MINNPVLNGKVSRGELFGKDGALCTAKNIYAQLRRFDPEEEPINGLFKEGIEAALVYSLAANQCRIEPLHTPLGAWRRLVAAQRLRRSAAWIISMLLQEKPAWLWEVEHLEIGAHALYPTLRSQHRAHHLARMGLERLQNERRQHGLRPHLEGSLRLIILAYLREHKELSRREIAEELAKVALLARRSSADDPLRGARLYRKLGEHYLLLLGRRARRKARRHFKTAERLARLADGSRELLMLKVA